MSEYSEKFKDPRWQRKRLEILERDGWTCKICGDQSSTLNVHHRFYTKSTDPWNYEDCVLITLCDECHAREHANMKQAQETLSVAMMRAGFTSDSFLTIAAGFSNMKLPYCQEITACVLEKSFSSEQIMENLLEEYWNEVRLIVRSLNA